MTIALNCVTIDRMRTEDIESVCEVESQCYPIPWQSSAYVTELGNACARYYVARCDGSVVGYAGMWVIMDEAHITTLAVSPAYQCRKIGERLLLTMVDEAIASGAEYITLEVRASNAVARHLYGKFGFAEQALRKAYYTDNWEDAVVMWLSGLRTPDYSQRLADLRARLPAIFHVRPRD